MSEEIKEKAKKEYVAYSEAIVDEICASLATGNSLVTTCKAEGMPSVRAVFMWMRVYPDFLKRYEKAKEESADYLAEEILNISDDSTNDYMQQFGEDGENIGWRVNHENIQRSRLRVDTRKWAAARLKPRKYGDRVQAEVSGPDGGPIKTESKVDTTNLTDDQLRALSSIKV